MHAQNYRYLIYTGIGVSIFRIPNRFAFIFTVGRIDVEKKAVEMKDDVSYGPVRVQSQTGTQEAVYEEPDMLKQAVDVPTEGNIAYGHIRR